MTQQCRRRFKIEYFRENLLENTSTNDMFSFFFKLLILEHDYGAGIEWLRLYEAYKARRNFFFFLI